MRFLHWVYLFVVLVGALPVGATMMQVTDSELLGKSDLIIVGTIGDTKVLPDEPSWSGGVAVIRVDQVLKGANDLLGKTVTVRYPIPPTMPPGTIILDHGGMVLPANEQKLFFLQRAQGGYAITGGQQGMRTVNDAERFRTLLPDVPVTLTMKPSQPAFYFKQAVPVTIIVENTGTTPIQLYQINLEGFFYSGQMESSLAFTLVNDAIKERGPMPLDLPAEALQPDQMIVNPGKTATLGFRYTLARPASWKVFTPDTYFQAPMAIRATVFLQPKPEVGAPQPVGYRIASPWVSSMTGFTPPADPLNLEAQK